jgi:hypothetical protein
MPPAPQLAHDAVRSDASADGARGVVVEQRHHDPGTGIEHGHVRVVSPQQRFHVRAQPGIGAALALEHAAAFVGFEFQDLVEQLVDSLPAVRFHHRITDGRPWRPAGPGCALPSRKRVNGATGTIA